MLDAFSFTTFWMLVVLFALLSNATVVCFLECGLLAHGACVLQYAAVCCCMLFYAVVDHVSYQGTAFASR